MATDTRKRRPRRKFSEEFKQQAVRLVLDHMTVDEVASLLRTTRRAIYAMVERGQLPGIVRVGRRVLFRSNDLLNSLGQKRASSLKE